MNKHLYRAAGAVGLLAIAWVASGYLPGNPLALAMTLLIAAFYVMGVLELQRFQQDTRGLGLALDGLAGTASAAAAPVTLADWLARVPAALRSTVRLRVDGERAALPGPSLTPYLAGLLVLLGMLGTFLGMVVTLNGTGLALERAGDVQGMRESLAAPVRGLGLAFGTSVAGVAASAMLGLMSALCRRERLHTAQRLDSHIATTLRPFTRAHGQDQQREAAFQLQQQQAQLQAQQMPQLLNQLQALMTQLEQQSRQSHAELLAGQQRFHEHAAQAYRALASSVDQTLNRSLQDSARTAAETLQPAVQATLSGITRETAALHGLVASTVQQQLDGLAQGFEQRSAAWVDTVGAQVKALLDDRIRTSATLDTLLGTVQHSATAQQAAVDQLVSSTAAWLQEAGARFTRGLDAESARADSLAAHLHASAVDVASLGDAFGAAVQLFSQSSDQTVAQLQRVEAALAKSSTRSDEQLAYCVAQAREVIDLSLLSQKQIVDELQRLARRQAAVASEA